jgi:Nif-specific regulatory protein
MAQGDTITGLAFPCRSNSCLTQVLHHVEREDAVRPGRLADIPVVEVPMTPTQYDHEAAAPLPASFTAVEADDDAAENDDGKPEGERDRLIWAMERCGWVQAKAARLLKISPRQMGYALQKNGIEVRKF